MPDRATAFEDDGAICDRSQLFERFVDHEDREALGLERADAGPDFLPHDRGEALGRLVEDQKARIGHQRAPDREHLLLAARKRARALAEALAQSRKQRDDAGTVPSAGARGDHEVFLDIERRKDAPTLGDEAQPAARGLMWCEAGQVRAVKADLAAAGAQKLHHRLDRRGFAHAVAAHKGQNLALGQIEGDPVQNRGLTIGGCNIAQRKQAHASSPR